MNLDLQIFIFVIFGFFELDSEHSEVVWPYAHYFTYLIFSFMKNESRIYVPILPFDNLDNYVT